MPSSQREKHIAAKQAEKKFLASSRGQRLMHLTRREFAERGGSFDQAAVSAAKRQSDYEASESRERLAALGRMRKQRDARRMGVLKTGTRRP